MRCPSTRELAALGRRRVMALRRHALAIGMLVDELDAPDLVVASAPVAVGDIVQLLPSTSPRFGGMLFWVREASPCRLRGYLLRAHRAGCRESWHAYSPGQVVRVGSTRFPDGDLSRSGPVG